MRSLGIWLIVFAIGSALLPMIGMQFILVAWIGLWGPTVAWIIRGAMVVAGLGLIGAETVAARRGGNG
jgi:hypothetical protein